MAVAPDDDHVVFIQISLASNTAIERFPGKNNHLDFIIYTCIIHESEGINLICCT